MVRQLQDFKVIHVEETHTQEEEQTREQEEERRFGEGEEDVEEAFSPLPESAEQVPKY